MAVAYTRFLYGSFLILNCVAVKRHKRCMHEISMKTESPWEDTLIQDTLLLIKSSKHFLFSSISFLTKTKKHSTVVVKNLENYFKAKLFIVKTNT